MIKGHYLRVDQIRRIRAETPVEALRLAEDIGALERIKREINSLDPHNCSDQEHGVSCLRLLRSMANLCHRYATQKMKEDFLNGEPMNRL